MLTEEEYTDFCKAVRKSTQNADVKNYLYDTPTWNFEMMQTIIKIAHLVVQMQEEKEETTHLMKLVIKLLELEGKRLNHLETFCQQMIKS